MLKINATSDTIACTLSAEDLEDVGAAWQKLFRTSLISRDLVPGGLRLTVHPGAEQALRSSSTSKRNAAGGSPLRSPGRV